MRPAIGAYFSRARVGGADEANAANERGASAVDGPAASAVDGRSADVEAEVEVVKAVEVEEADVDAGEKMKFGAQVEMAVEVVKAAEVTAATEATNAKVGRNGKVRSKPEVVAGDTVGNMVEDSSVRGRAVAILSVGVSVAPASREWSVVAMTSMGLNFWREDEEGVRRARGRGRGRGRGGGRERGRGRGGGLKRKSGRLLEKEEEENKQDEEKSANEGIVVEGVRDVEKEEELEKEKDKGSPVTPPEKVPARRRVVWHKPLSHSFDDGAVGEDDDEIPAVPLDNHDEDDDCVEVVEDDPPAPSACDVVVVPDSPVKSRKRQRGGALQKPVHPFFVKKIAGAHGAEAAQAPPANATARVSESAERATASVRERAAERAKKRLRSTPVEVDAWEASSIATVHVNAPAVEGLRNGGWGGGKGGDVARVELDDPFWSPRFVEGRVSEVHTVEEVAEKVGGGVVDGAALWSEVFKKAGVASLDALSEDKVDDLAEWLTPFFRKRGKNGHGGDSGSGSQGSDGSESSCSSGSAGGDRPYRFSRADSDNDEPGDDELVENVCLLTGPVGSGKTTVVQQAAKRLGLTILEINPMMMRTGRRVKEKVSESLATHRIAAGKKGAVNHTQNDGFNTLIVFEEVDLLAEDERGFWAAIAELSALAGSRRPVVMTANRMTPDMLAVFGDSSAYATEISDLTGSRLPEECEPILPLLKRISLQSPSPKSVNVSLGSVLRRAGMKVASTDKRVLTGLFAEGDCRAAINSSQFWTLPGAGSICENAILWPEAGPDLISKSHSEISSVFRSLAKVPEKLSHPEGETKTLGAWADILDCISEAEVCNFDPVVERTAFSKLAEDGLDISPPSPDTSAGTLYYYHLAYYLTSTSIAGHLQHSVVRQPASTRLSHNADVRGSMRTMASLEAQRRRSDTTRNRTSGRTTRASVCLRPSTFSRLSKDSLSELIRELPKLEQKESI